MTTITFDTLKFARRLKNAGVPDNHAEAEAEAIKEAFSEALDSQLATKQDINELSVKIKLVQWMIALVIAVEIIPLLKTLF